MRKKPPGSRSFILGPVENRRYVHERELWLYARSFHVAAKTLAASFQPTPNEPPDFAACPVVFMYRHAIELHLKATVLGEGGNFLTTALDTLSIYRTHSVSWLAQFVSQIILALKWEKKFKCAGIGNLADFKVVMEELSVVDPGSYVFELPVSAEKHDSVPGSAKLIEEFARRMDALLELLDSTADALAAEWDMRSEARGVEPDSDEGKDEPKIH